MLLRNFRCWERHNQVGPRVDAEGKVNLETEGKMTTVFLPLAMLIKERVCVFVRRCVFFENNFQVSSWKRCSMIHKGQG